MTALCETRPWHRNGYSNSAPEGIENRDANCTDPGIVLAKIESQMLVARLIQFAQKFGAVRKRVRWMRGDASVDQGGRLLLRVAG